ncbi:MAG: exosortase C-terminal domain/associated protein EpsI [Syntrophobacteraceae bacterium]|jgi:EpsI family protein
MRRFIITIFILILAIIAGNLPASPEPVLTRTSLKEFPSKIGDWTLQKEQKIDDKSMAVLQVDDYTVRTYANSKGESISLYIGYFKTQKEGKTNHSPRQCLPGAGWSPIETTSLMLDVPAANSGQIPANRYLMEKGDEKELFLFWYQGRGRQLANEYIVKAYLMWDSITRNRTDGALIRVNAPASSNPDKALEKLMEFIRSFYPVLSKFIPE